MRLAGDLQVFRHHVAGLAVHADLIPVALTGKQGDRLAVTVIAQSFAVCGRFPAQEENLRIARIVDHRRADGRRDGGAAAVRLGHREPAGLHIAGLTVHADLAPFAVGGENRHLRAARIGAHDISVRRRTQVQSAGIRLDVSVVVRFALGSKVLGVHVAALAADIDACPIAVNTLDKHLRTPAVLTQHSGIRAFSGAEIQRAAGDDAGFVFGEGCEGHRHRHAQHRGASRFLFVIQHSRKSSFVIDEGVQAAALDRLLHI